MGRYETLNAASKDVVDCLLPGIASNFGVADVVNVIPEDIRMRAWDCDRKEHIYDETEEDPRNWGLQFLKDLISISRIKKNKLDEFQADLRKKVEDHEDDHPWARLADIKELKQQYEHPERELPSADVQPPEESSSESSYYEELVEPEESSTKKRGRTDDRFEARKVKLNPQTNKKRKRLRKSSSSGWERPEKSKRRIPIQDVNVDGGANDDELDDLSVEELEAHLLVSQAELKAARVKLKVIEARRKAARERQALANGKVEQKPTPDQNRDTGYMRKPSQVRDAAYTSVPSPMRTPARYSHNIEHYEHDRVSNHAPRSSYERNIGHPTARKSEMMDRKNFAQNHGPISARKDSIDRLSKEPTVRLSSSLQEAYADFDDEHEYEKCSSHSSE